MMLLILFFQLSPSCIKAHIHMGRAHLGMKDYNKARECFLEAKKFDPKIENVIKGYLHTYNYTTQRSSIHLDY